VGLALYLLAQAVVLIRAVVLTAAMPRSTTDGAAACQAGLALFVYGFIVNLFLAGGGLNTFFVMLPAALLFSVRCAPCRAIPVPTRAECRGMAGMAQTDRVRKPPYRAGGQHRRAHRSDRALLVSAIVLARLLGPAGLGVVAIATATVRLATIPVEEGAAKLCEREIAGAIGKGDPCAGQRGAALRSDRALSSLGVLGRGNAVGPVPAGRPVSAHGDRCPAGRAGPSMREPMRHGGAARPAAGAGQTTWAIKVTNAQSLLAPVSTFCGRFMRGS
jgi:hypothetical protein